MPYVLLDFTRVEESDLATWRSQSPKAIFMKLLEPNTGKTVRLEIDVCDVRQTERDASLEEVNAVRKMFAVPDDHKTLYEKEKLANESLREQIEKLRERDFDEETRKYLADALDMRIEELAASRDISGYQAAKKIFKRLTGKAWVEDGSDEDQEGEIQVKISTS